MANKHMKRDSASLVTKNYEFTSHEIPLYRY